MTYGYQIYKYDPKYNECFVHAGLINWFPTLKQAQARVERLTETWGKKGVQYTIIKCQESDNYEI